ncbi:MAG: hypothetical protein FJ109_09210 [Deltaproteobacteria bacterium]|nr:hypothetical protein [Deltaproteobacteria bacterium]
MNRLILAMLVAVSVSVTALAAPPGQVRYQGFLTDKEGTPVEGEWVVTFRLFETEAGAVPFFEETQTVHPVHGVFSVVLGSAGSPVPAEAFVKGKGWLGIVVNGPDGPVELLPRQRVVTTPFAFVAGQASTCDQASNALSLGGVGAGSYVTLTQLPELCVTPEALPELVDGMCVSEDELPALLEALGVGSSSLTIGEVQTWLELNGYVTGPHFSGKYGDLTGAPDPALLATKDDLSLFATKDDLLLYAQLADITDLVTAPQCIDAVKASGAVLLADGSVALQGDLDINGNVLKNLAVQYCPKPTDLPNPPGGMMCFDLATQRLMVYAAKKWVAVGGVAADLDCPGCVSADDVAFNFAASDSKNGAAVDLNCNKCVGAGELAVNYAEGTAPGGDAIKALTALSADDVACAGCVQKGELAAGVLASGNVAYDDSVTKLGGANVQDAIVKLHQKVGTGGGEGFGQMFMQAREWALPAYGRGRTYMHLFNPQATAKVLAYLYADEVSALPGATKLLSGPFAPNAYSAVTGTKNTNHLIASKPEVFNVNSHLLVHQTAGANPGAWELSQVVGVEGSTLVLSKPLANDYVDGAQAVVATSYGQLVVESGGELKAIPYSASAKSGGIVYVRAESILVKNGGKVLADGAGFPGGTIPFQGTAGHQGASECSVTGSNSANNNCSGGGGSTLSAGAGGGGNKTAGETIPNGGKGGTTKGDANLATLQMGGGGGKGGTQESGGAGGGIVVLGAGTVVVEGAGVLSAAGASVTQTQPSCQYPFVHMGYQLCGKTATANDQANTPPAGCSPITPNTNWGQGDFTTICQHYMNVFGGPVGGCSAVDMDADGGNCSNYPAILGFERNSGPDVWVHSGTFSWVPTNSPPGNCNITNASDDILVYACGGVHPSGAGAGGTVAIFADTFVNSGSVDVKGGTSPAGDGGTGWFAQKPPVPGIVHAMYPKGVQIWVDGVDVTAAVGDPHGKGTPAWDKAKQLWGETGTAAWSSGMLDLSSVAAWTLGEHIIELRETGGAGGNLKVFLYTIYAFTNATAPQNDTCQSPTVIAVDKAGKYSGTTEDAMGKLKANDDYNQSGCGGTGGADVVYQFTIPQYSQVQFDVVAPFDARLYLRQAGCVGGALVACGKKSLKTDPLKPNTYFLFVDADTALAKGDFTLVVTPVVPGPPNNDTCASPTLLDLSKGPAEFTGLSLFAKDDYMAGCGGVNAKDVVFQFDVPPAVAKLNIQIAASYQPVMYLKKDNCAGSAIVCVPGASYTMQWPAEGTYYLVLDGQGANEAGEYTVKVSLE